MGKEHNGKTLREIMKGLESFAPLSLAETWDNVGLLIDPMKNEQIHQILLTNDLTEEIVDEAIDLNAKMIITYHPIIFQGLKSVNTNHWKERVVIKCIRDGISVFSPHTSWDCVKGGVNDWLSSAFQVKNIGAIKSGEDPQVGAGRICTLNEPITLQQAIHNVKSLINLPHVRLALGKGKHKDSLISTVALCAGSGASVLKDVNADLYLTGEMLHHDILEATQRGIHVILCNHSDSERGFLKEFQQKLKLMLNNECDVLLSKFDHDPLNTV